jgi:hypothetical protein
VDDVRDIKSPVLNLDGIPLGQVLMGNDTALSRAVGRLHRSAAEVKDEEDLRYAGFNNFV